MDIKVEPMPAVAVAIAREAFAEGRGAVDAVVEWHRDRERLAAKRAAERMTERPSLAQPDPAQWLLDQRLADQPERPLFPCASCGQATLWSERIGVAGQIHHVQCWSDRRRSERVDDQPERPYDIGLADAKAGRGMNPDLAGIVGGSPSETTSDQRSYQRGWLSGQDDNDRPFADGLVTVKF